MEPNNPQPIPTPTATPPATPEPSAPETPPSNGPTATPAGMGQEAPPESKPQPFTPTPPARDKRRFIYITVGVVIAGVLIVFLLS